MSYFSLPSVSNNYLIHESLSFEQHKLNSIDAAINITLNTYITQAKGLIDSRQLEWNTFKKYTNTFEYIHTHVPGTKYSVGKLKPLSRSFYKLIEICKTMRLNESLPANDCKTFHFAEGPGGFIEAISYIRENPTDKYYGMSLLDGSMSNIPGWNKSQEFLNENKNVSIWSGSSGDGDMLKADNLISCYNHHKSSCHLVTGDGGFDFALDFKHQEVVSIKLAFAQCAYAFSCQKKGGSFVLKLFDTYTQASIDILYILASVYEKVYFLKPHTSRQANSEKYIVCKNFKLENTFEIVRAMYRIINAYDNRLHAYRFLNCNIPYRFICAVQEINAILGQSQLENITTTIHIIDSCSAERLENLKRNNVIKCVNWCQKFKIPHNKVFPSRNLFMPTHCLESEKMMCEI
jgi:23S rRNA U2552 (ribose-2'-O)-methylase RlmE/FtsJ